MHIDGNYMQYYQHLQSYHQQRVVVALSCDNIWESSSMEPVAKQPNIYFGVHQTPTTNINTIEMVTIMQGEHL